MLKTVPTIKQNQDWVKWGLGACIFLLLVSNGIMFLGNRRLVDTITDIHSQIDLPLGAKMPALHGKTLDNADVAIGFGDRDKRGTLLLIYSPACPVCEENWPNWTRLISNKFSSNFRIIAIDLANITRADYIDAHNMRRLMILRNMDPQTILAYRLRMTPDTILLNHSGVVKGSWTGVLSTDAVDKILTFAG